MGLPIPNLDDKTFEELVNEARSLIARYTPEWTDHNVHDPGITFIDLFAWLAEIQIYQLNRVTEAHYQKFLQLVEITPHPMQPARVAITFKDLPQKKPIIVRAGTQIITEVGRERIVFETEQDFTLIPVKLKKVVTTFDSQIIDHTEVNERGDMYFAPFGEKASEGAELRIGFDQKLPAGQEIRINFVLFEKDLSSVGNNGKKSAQVLPSVNLEWEYLNGGKWHALPIKKDSTLALTKSGSFVFAGPPDMEEKDETYWIRCRLKEGSYEIVPLLNRILLNTVTVVQIESIKNEDLGTGQGIPEQRVQLKKTPVLSEKKGSQVIQVQGANGEWEDWEEVNDFELSGPDDPHYMFDPEKGEITFGNGLNGRIPLKSQRIQASYKTTLGPRGNIPKGQRWWFEGVEGIVGEATGGMAAESIEETKDRAKKDFRTPYRAITSDDYEQLALFTPGLRVARAKAIPNYHPDYPCISIPGTVTIVVVPPMREETSSPDTVDLRNCKTLPSSTVRPESCPERIRRGVEGQMWFDKLTTNGMRGSLKPITPVPGESFLQTIKNHLEKHRLVTIDLHVIGPEYIKVSVTCKIHLKKRSSPIETEKRVRKALEGFLDPLKGGPDKQGWPFGRSVFPSEIYQLIDKVEGVNYVTGVALSAEGQYRKIDDIIKIPPCGLVYSGEHEVEVI